MTKSVDKGNPAALRDLGKLLLGHSNRFRSRDLQSAAARLLPAAGGDSRPISILNYSLELRQRADYLLRLTPRRVLSKLTYPLRGAGRHRGTPRTLSLLCPTRGRVEGVTRFLDSVIRTSIAPGRIEAMFYVDDDDPDLDWYRELFARSAWRFGAIGACRLVVGPPVGVPAAWNTIAEAAAGDLLLMANDDQLYVEYGWDVALDDRVSDLTALYPDGVMCLYFDAGQYPEGACDFPIVTRPWYDTLGYFTPTIFQQWEVEKWVFDIADRLGRLHPVPGVLVEHLHYQEYKAPFDATYQRHRMTREKSYSDHALFLRTQNARNDEVTRLKRHIEACTDATGTCGTEFDDPWFSSTLVDMHAGVRHEFLRSERSAVLYADGRWTEAAQHFPVTRSVLEMIPEATSAPERSVEVRRLDPGDQLPSMTGLQVVLGLKVPQSASLEVSGRFVDWGEGRCVFTREGRSRYHGTEVAAALVFAVPLPDRAG